jgi:CheY-like chemotaxis protein
MIPRSLHMSRMATQPSAPPCELLEDAGHRPIVAFALALQAFAALRHFPQLLVLLLDLGLPHLDDAGLLRHVTGAARQRRACPACLCAGHHERQDRHPRRRVPGCGRADSSVHKPFDIDQLLAIVAPAACRLPGPTQDHRLCDT